ncbi:hypothetical protein ACFZDF_30555 [Streptomyces sp. NPDC007910]|uniref:hypothetical protein n=1 Tax=Streptomyces sp. NPDC007910 TaxID=3364790 RepID=UPI0036E804E7
MGQSTNAMLMYGYHLGSADGGWQLHGLGEYDELPALGWYNPEDEDGIDFQSAAERKLMADIAGFTEEWSSEAEGYFDRERAAKARLGVEFDSHCSGDYPMYVLATKVITVYRGDVEEIDPARDLAVQPDWDDKLRTALDILGLNPTQKSARWLLCSYWG